MRDKNIDLLRFIGMSALIMAHVESPGWIFQLCNFSVPLIVMTSAMAMACSPMKETYWSYVGKRIKRLLFPVWFFLTFYFIFIRITGIAPNYLTAQHIWDTYTLSNSGGFMWIIRIFLLVALSAPFIYQLNQSIRSNKLYLSLLLLGYLAYEVFMYGLQFCPEGFVKDFADSIICYALGYGLIFALGIRLNKLTVREWWLTGGVLFFVFAVLCGMHYFQEGHFVQTQKHKYPPSAYFVSYSMIASLVIWYLAKYICGFLKRISWLEGIVMFIAQNSLWIYFWHTLFLFVAYRMHDQNFLAKYMAVYSLSALAVFAQKSIVENLIFPRISNQVVRKEIKGILAG